MTCPWRMGKDKDIKETGGETGRRKGEVYIGERPEERRQEKSNVVEGKKPKASEKDGRK